MVWAMISVGGGRTKREIPKARVKNSRAAINMTKTINGAKMFRYPDPMDSGFRFF
jgi:hypothetical protein